MYRRSLLAALAPLAGCSALTGGDGRTTATETPTATPEPTRSLPLTAADPDGNVGSSRGIEVRNRRSVATFTTVVVEHEGETVFTESQTVPPDRTWHVDDLVSRRGIYHVIVEAETGERAVHGWVVGERWGEWDLIASLTPAGVETQQVGICAPDCPPLRARGQSRPLPRESPTDPGREVAGAVTLRNDRDRTVPVSLRVAGDRGRIVDYTYDLPAGVEIIVPVARSDGTYDLAVSARDRTVSRTWHVPEEPFPRFAVGDTGAAPACEASDTRVTRISNSRESETTVGVALRSGDDPGVARTATLGPGESRPVGLRVPPGPTTLSVFVDDERRLTAEWTICPAGPIRITLVGGTVFVRNDERVVASAFAE
ncbi:MAG: hypothetical protein V5A31_00660 [Haloferacaceae archaeon]